MKLLNDKRLWACGADLRGWLARRISSIGQARLWYSAELW